MAARRAPISALEFGGEGFVGVEGEDPGSGAALDGEVFLSGEALPGLEEDLALKSAAISRVRSVEPESTTTISSAN